LLKLQQCLDIVQILCVAIPLPLNLASPGTFSKDEVNSVQLIEDQNENVGMDRV
jgi:hypothetical protein